MTPWGDLSPAGRKIVKNIVADYNAHQLAEHAMDEDAHVWDIEDSADKLGYDLKGIRGLLIFLRKKFRRQLVEV